MISAHTTRDVGIAGFGALVLFLILSWPASETSSPYPYPRPLQSAADTLKGAGSASDLAQDIIGFRAMVRQDNAYPILGLAGKALGLEWPVAHVSTHPPTAFVLVAPIAFLPWPLAAMIWAWLMLGLLACAFRLYGLSWLAALGLTPIALLWPPVSTSLGQFTIIWLFGLAVGHRYMRRNYLLSGVGIGLAALTKLIPGVMIILFLSKRRWHAILGIALVGVVSLASAVLLSPDVIYQYVQANRLNSITMMLREDNASLLGTGYRWGGGWGVIPVFMFLALIVWANRRAVCEESTLLPSTTLWMLLTYVSVALLPLSWIYSLTPLLPVIVFLVAKGKLSTLCIGLCCIGIPWFVPIWGPRSVLPLVLVNILIGVGLIVDASPSRLLTARSLRTLRARPREKSRSRQSGDGRRPRR
jgi:hypothetical protein